MIVWRRERRNLKFMALSIGRIGSESTQAPSLSIGDRRLSRFRSSATPPTCVRVRDRLTLSNAGSRLKTRGDNPGGSGRARRGLPTRPLAFSGRVLRALRREPSHSTRSSHLITRDSLILWRRVAAPAAHLSPLHHIITRLGKSCENGLGIPRWPPQSNRLNENPADSILAKCSALQNRSRAKTKRLAN